MKLTLCLTTVLTAATALIAADDYSINFDKPLPPVMRGHLDLGGTSPSGGRIDVTNRYIEQDGKPIIPVMGEFHFHRYPAADWEQELRKMKAGGIDIVATYVHWNLHERTQGEFDWSGNLNLRHFVELSAKVGLPVIVRIGPFGHGEMRNGGLPDWLYGLPLEVRSNDPTYLEITDRLYAQIGAQLTGLYYKDGGPIIGTQLENEFQHSAAPWEIRYGHSPLEVTVADRDIDVTHAGVSVSNVVNKNAGYGQDHMANLKIIAKRHGLDTPLYTATGWGNAAIVPNGSLPVTAGYPFPYWSEPAPSTFFLFRDIVLEPDYSPVSYDTKLYPSIAAELGGGMSVGYARRPYVPEDSLEPMIIRFLGSGSNGIGYYMYQGGATPVYDGIFYNEDASGLPKINYDYQAPLSQYGVMRSHFQSLRMLHLFMQDYGSKLAPLPTLFPATNAGITPEDTETLRYVARAADGSGFLFLLNYQDHVDMADIKGVRIDVKARGETVSLPHSGSFDLLKDTCAILPINLDLDGSLLRSATVQPLAILKNEGRISRIFFSIPGLRPELVFKSGNVTDAQGCTVTSEEGLTIVRGNTEECFSFSVGDSKVLVLTRDLALQATRIGDGHLVFSPEMLYASEGALTLASPGQPDVTINVYPGLAKTPEVKGANVAESVAASPLLSAFTVNFKPVHYKVDWKQVSSRRYSAILDETLPTDTETFLRIDYYGDTGMAFIQGEMIDDQLYFGRVWEIGLKRFMPRLIKHNQIDFVFHALTPDATFFGDIPESRRPVFGPNEKQHLSIRSVELVPEYRAQISWPSSIR